MQQLNAHTEMLLPSKIFLKWCELVLDDGLGTVSLSSVSDVDGVELSVSCELYSVSEVNISCISLSSYSVSNVGSSVVDDACSSASSFDVSATDISGVSVSSYSVSNVGSLSVLVHLLVHLM